MGVDWDAMYEEYRYRGPAERKLLLLRKNQEPGPEPDAGCACGGMYTANTMASAIEVLGLSLPYNSSNPAVSQEKSLEITQVNRDQS